ncbi:MAG: PH domain-containing protein [Candidatus Thorarchaeota archaeon]|nr:PH domain-containing protein [Candidatus Thorarchaeota archaeon]
MAQGEGRVIKPPIEQVVSGRVFHPDNAFLYKKWLRMFLILILIWTAIFIFFTLANDPVFIADIMEIAMWTEVLFILGWETVNLYYWLTASSMFVLWMVYTYIYVKRIDYSLASWEGDVSPEIYVRKGIIQITQKHVPFHTITHVKTRRGVFDRLFGIGTIQIETAAKSSTAQGGGMVAFILQRLMRGGTGAENIEGVKFHEELRDFILRELRGFSRTPILSEPTAKRRQRKRIINRDTLEAFREIRDALILEQRER